MNILSEKDMFPPSTLKLPDGYTFVIAAVRDGTDGEKMHVTVWQTPVGIKYASVTITDDLVIDAEWWSTMLKTLIARSDADPLLTLFKLEHPNEPELVAEFDAAVEMERAVRH